nr:SOS response-associated peptidase family protein [Burkholderia sp. SRS-W-2-2016]
MLLKRFSTWKQWSVRRRHVGRFCVGVNIHARSHPRDVFYENVSKAKFEGTLSESHEKDGSIVLAFRPNNGQLMLVACLWSRWSAPGEPDLLSFAAITDEPPAEVAAAGHDRYIIPIKPENIDAWLNPDTSDLTASYAILDDKERPYYEHRLAA